MSDDGIEDYRKLVPQFIVICCRIAFIQNETTQMKLFH